jgi:predicted acyltransferase (DUF342 family)
MTEGGIAIGLNQAIKQSVMAEGGIAVGLNQAIKQSVMAEGGIAVALLVPAQPTLWLRFGRRLASWRRLG